MRVIFTLIVSLLWLGSCGAELIAPGVDYVAKYIANHTMIQVLTIDPLAAKIILVRAIDVGSSAAQVREVAKEFSAVAAVNGGFFRYEATGAMCAVPAGAMKAQGVWHGIAYKTRGAIGWTPGTKQVSIDRIKTTSTLSIGDKSYPVNFTNKLPGYGKAAVLTDSYIDRIELRTATAVSINNHTVNGVYQSGQHTITPNCYMYLFYPESPLTIQTGATADFKVRVVPQLDHNARQAWQEFPFILGGGPLLIKNQQQITDYLTEELQQDFLHTKYARTAVGVLPNGHWVLVTVYRNHLLGMGGMTISELSDFMLWLGCVDALNLDGGGSSAMFVANLVEDIPANPVADVLLVVPNRS